jgi:hypothetical protein
MIGIAGNTSFLGKTHSKKGVAVMNRDESHRQGRGLSLSPGTSSAADLDLELRAVQERVMIVRSFVNCPSLRHFFLVLVASFSMTYKRQGNCTVTGKRFQTRRDVKNPERSEWTSRPQNQRSIGSSEFSRIETATPIRRGGPADSPGFARANAGGSRGGQIFGAMRF